MAIAPPAVDVPAFIAEQKFGPYHVRILVLCALAMFVDGFDTQAMGYVAPAMTKALHLKPGELWPVFSFFGFGAIIGTLGLAPLSDRFGRKPIMIYSLMFFAVMSALTSTAETVPTLAVMRFLTALGLGGLVPNGLALAAEYMPKKFRVTLVILVWFGFSLGSGFAGEIIAEILRFYSWHAVFLVGAILPFTLVFVLALWLPESILLLTDRGNVPAQVGAILRHINPSAAFDSGTTFVNSEPKEKGFPVALLFREGRAPVTILLWIMFFVNLMALFFMNSWLPTILNNAGQTVYAAIIIGSISHFGGIVGGLALAPLCDRYNKYVVLACAFVLSAASIAMVGVAGGHAWFATTAVFFAGFFTFGGQNAANAIAATSYPTAMRSTGTGWALGIGRTGQIVGPYVGGWLLSMHWAANDIMYVVAIPGLIAAASALMINLVTRSQRAATGARRGDVAHAAH